MISHQAPSTVLMVRPASIFSNPQTAASNSFQKSLEGKSSSELLNQARTEFDSFVHALERNRVNVLVMEDTSDPVKPDAIFPNNWISFHEGGLIITYPMMAENRRLERRRDINRFMHENELPVTRHWDITAYENGGEFLEGTGSMVFDYDHKLAYANLSPRTNYRLLDLVCKELGYEPVKFRAIDKHGDDIYHTNVVMGVADNYAIVCLDCIREGKERVVKALESSGKTIIPITFDQMYSFAGNILQVKSRTNEMILLVSRTAWDSFTFDQKKQLQDLNTILPLNVKTIEALGGGSVRCMVAGVHF